MGWIAMKFGSGIHAPLRINCDHFDDPLTFRLAPSSGQDFTLTNDIPISLSCTLCLVLML